MYRTLILASTLLLSGLPTTATAIDKSEVRTRWHTPFDLYLSAQEAYAMKTSRPDEVLFIDVRTRPEVHYIGIADQVDANIPYQFDSLEWKTKSGGTYGTYRKKGNPDFVQAVDNALAARGLDRNSPVIIMCTSGSRAPYAASALYKAGFKAVYTQVEGFEGIKATEGEHKGKRVVAGWKNEGLPWGYKLPTAKMYFNFDPARHAERSAPTGGPAE